MVFLIYPNAFFVIAQNREAKDIISIEDRLAQVESLYNQAQYQQVIITIDSIFRTTRPLTETTLVQLYTYQAFAYVALERKELAQNTFRYLLMLNPKLTLDPRYVSPKIIEIFEESKRQLGDTLKLTPTFYLGSKINNRAVKVRSLIYPGLGQLSVKQKTKGYLFLSTETISILGLIVSHFMTNSAHQDYLNNRNLAEMDAKYNKYSFWYQCRIGFAISSIGIWLLNYIDVSLY
ncbi:MAG: hypothetical protein N2201_05850 [candidate division WOR-3 bacterium]|nr:hypothetical protein [candidate division WOR-3 bacterium]